MDSRILGKYPSLIIIDEVHDLVVSVDGNTEMIRKLLKDNQIKVFQSDFRKDIDISKMIEAMEERQFKDCRFTPFHKQNHGKKDRWR